MKHSIYHNNKDEHHGTLRLNSQTWIRLACTYIIVTLSGNSAVWKGLYDLGLTLEFNCLGEQENTGQLQSRYRSSDCLPHIHKIHTLHGPEYTPNL